MLLAQFVVGLTTVFDLVLVSLNRNEFYAISRWVAVIATGLISVPLISRFQLSGLMYGVLSASLVSMITSLVLLQRACGVVTKLSLGSIIRPPLTAVAFLVCGSIALAAVFQDSTSSLLSLALRGLLLVLSYIVAVLSIPSLRKVRFAHSGSADNGR